MCGRNFRVSASAKRNAADSPEFPKIPQRQLAGTASWRHGFVVHERDTPSDKRRPRPIARHAETGDTGAMPISPRFRYSDLGSPSERRRASAMAARVGKRALHTGGV